MTPEHVAAWAATHALSPLQIDCAVTVMLKILDGKCKMPAQEKVVMELLYDRIKHLPGQLLDHSVHELIESARNADDEALKNLIYEKRLLAETAISRPVMKSFKAMIRAEGLLPAKTATDSED
ncbi:hypothetical protein PL263_01780 [Methylomonas sp. EFPC3]|uniref:hypothetical protein n=1 Tax=Methylomonas sp. EFPC3 TaxID=3021710 RepID=UPI0024160365|nr:hypothetical protein [Methylomonas sp. EFPC3]WFP50765.1 hypothetical protein PL263_01780 [Methylomonas sp. EFPC3]